MYHEEICSKSKHEMPPSKELGYKQVVSIAQVLKWYQCFPVIREGFVEELCMIYKRMTGLPTGKLNLLEVETALFDLHVMLGTVSFDDENVIRRRECL